MRPVVNNGHERELVYVYGAISPREGESDRMIFPKMNAGHTGQFFLQIHAAHPDEFIIMVVDGASSPVSKDLAVPDNIRLLRPPRCAPELNPQEPIRDGLRDKEFPNRGFAGRTSPARQLQQGMPRLAMDSVRLR